MNKPYPVILDRIFYWEVRTTRDRNRYAPKGAPRCPIQGIMMDSKAFHAVGRIPKVIRVRIEVLPDDYSDDAPSTDSARGLSVILHRGVGVSAFWATPLH